jgi:putative DNA primase/helicase
MATDPSLVFARRLCQENNFITVQEHGKIYIYWDGYYKAIKSSKNAGVLHKLIIDAENGENLTPAGRDKVIRNIEALTIVPEHKINPEGIFNFKDCLYDITTNTQAKHSPEYLTTTQLPYEFKTQIDCPTWKEFLNHVLENDINKINILQEFVGYCLMKSCKRERALFLLGSGSNGKSTFTETIMSVFGNHNCSSVSLQNMANPVLRCDLINKYINIDSDLPKNAMDFEEIFRKVSSGEPVQFNEKYLASITQSPFCKLIYCLNTVPRIHDTSNAFYRRMLLVKFPVEIIEENQDVNLKEKLKSELAGIFRWAVQGLNRLNKQNSFSSNIDMKKTIADIKIDNNPILSFAEEHIIFEPGHDTYKTELYSRYVEWTKRNGFKPLSSRNFINSFYEAFSKKTKKEYLSGDSRRSAWKDVKYIDQNPAEKQVETWSE